MPYGVAFWLLLQRQLHQYNNISNPTLDMNNTKASEKRKPKKPFHIKKADLRLDEYKQEIKDRSPSLLFRNAWEALLTSRKFHSYLVIQVIAAALGYGQFIFCIGILWMMYVNTGTRKAGEKSAYSLFNENFEAIDGATSMEDIDRELRRQMY